MQCCQEKCTSSVLIKRYVQEAQLSRLGFGGEVKMLCDPDTELLAPLSPTSE